MLRVFAMVSLLATASSLGLVTQKGEAGDYVGCFDHLAAYRAGNFRAHAKTVTTVQECADACPNSGKYFGLTDPAAAAGSAACYCGDAEGTTAFQSNTKSNCKTCNFGKCGNHGWVISVYQFAIQYPQVQFVAPGAMTIGAVKATCQALGDGWQPVSIQNVDHVKWLVSQADAQGIDLTVHAGVPLAYDPSNQNKYFDLNDATREVTSIFASLNAEGWPGDYHTNQAASCGGRGQPFAGFGWRSQATPGIEDWGDCHSFNKLLCEKKEAAAGEASTSSSYTTQQGLCRQDAKYGGWCSCECAGNRCATAADCFAKAANMASVMAVEYRTSNQQCALLHSSQDAPTDCPADCDPAGGNGDVTVYTGDGNSDNVCMHPAEDSSTEAATEAGTITVPAGTSRAATRNILEAQCVNFDHLGGDYFFKLNMGDVNDYYRPTNKADKLCDVLLAENPNAKFDWAPTEDGEFKTPDRYGDNFGGSAENWLPEQGIAGDDRKWLSVWMGSSDWQTAGCCVVDYADSGAQWGRGYIITVMSTKGTEAPAPAPVSESAAKGDPHLMNLKGEAFDVMQTGNMMLLEIPRGSSPAALDLALHADIERLGVVSCGPTFITSASIRGRWIGVPLEIRSGPISKEGRHQPKLTFAIRFDEKAWLPHAEMQRTMELSKDATIEAHDRMFLLQVRGLDIAVSQPKRPRIFLDIQVKGLGNLKTEIGGLLGMDDHSSVEELPSECEVSASSLSLDAMRNDEALQWSARALL